MTRTFIADASVAIGWVHPGQATTHTAAMLDAIAGGATVEVPALWPLEVANALTVLVRRRKLPEAIPHPLTSASGSCGSATHGRIAHDCRVVVSACAVNGLMICSRSTSPTASSGTSARGGYWAGGAGFVASITMAVIGRAALVPSGKYS